MLNLEQLLKYVIRPALTITGLHSDAAERLVLFTGYIESNYVYLKQNPGPALGIFQCEPRTHEDVKKWLSHRMNKALLDRVLAACFMSVLPDDNALCWNLRYAALICRLVYYRSPKELPDMLDAVAMSAYHKRIYNGGSLGKADPEKNAQIYRELFLK